MQGEVVKRVEEFHKELYSSRITVPLVTTSVDDSTKPEVITNELVSAI